MYLNIRKGSYFLEIRAKCMGPQQFWSFLCIFFHFQLFPSLNVEHPIILYSLIGQSNITRLLKRNCDLNFPLLYFYNFKLIDDQWKSEVAFFCSFDSSLMYFVIQWWSKSLWRTLWFLLIIQYLYAYYSICPSAVGVCCCSSHQVSPVWVKYSLTRKNWTSMTQTLLTCTMFMETNFPSTISF